MIYQMPRLLLVEDVACWILVILNRWDAMPTAEVDFGTKRKLWFLCQSGEVIWMTRTKASLSDKIMYEHE